MTRRMIVGLTLLIILSVMAGLGYAVHKNGEAAKRVVWDIGRIEAQRQLLQLPYDSEQANINGAAVATAPLIRRDGVDYFPLDLIEEAGIGQVLWDEDKLAAMIVLHEEIESAHRSIGLRVGSGLLHPGVGEQDNVASTIINAPFLERGILYGPLSILTYMNVQFEEQAQGIEWYWIKRQLLITNPNLEITGTEVTLSMLYANELPMPQLLLSNGSGGWTGLRGQVTEKSTLINGKSYRQLLYNPTLQPGVNAIKLAGSADAGHKVMIYRSFDEKDSIEVKIFEEGKPYIALNQPQSGYVQAAVMENVPVEGRMIVDRSDLEELTLAVFQYNEGQYMELSRSAVAIEDGQFSAGLQWETEGEYVVQIISPKYIPHPEFGSLAAVWAELRVRIVK